MFTSLLVCVLFVCVASHPHETDSKQLYSNSWAVELKGGPQAAQELARKHGFIYKGQVCLLINMRTIDERLSKWLEFI